SLAIRITASVRSTTAGTASGSIYAATMSPDALTTSRRPGSQTRSLDSRGPTTRNGTCSGATPDSISLLPLTIRTPMGVFAGGAVGDATTTLGSVRKTTTSSLAAVLVGSVQIVCRVSEN